MKTLNQKKLLILGAGRGQIGLYKAAKSLGVHTIAATMHGEKLPCLPFADDVCWVNIANPDEVLEKASHLEIDGIATSCLDTGVRSLGKVCDALKLTGLSEASAKLCNDKLMMKQALIRHKVNTARFYKVTNQEELQQALNKLQFPVVIKAIDLQGSNGVYICHSTQEALESFLLVQSKTKQDFCLIEEFIEGLEFGAQAFVYQGEVLFVMPHGDTMIQGHTPVPIGHYIPFSKDKQLLSKIEHIVKQAIQALGLNNCAVNVDLILKDEKFYIIELTGRVGANCLPEIVSAHFNLDYYQLILLMSLGENPLEYWHTRKVSEKSVSSRMIFEFRNTGILDSICYQGEENPDILDLNFFKSKGDEVRVFENSNDCIGQVIVQANTENACREYLAEVLKKIKITLQ